MDLLTEIADDRLVIMVTHNPELAQRYATRIVHLGRWRHTAMTTRPFDPAAENSPRRDREAGSPHQHVVPHGAFPVVQEPA